ncbi:MAG: O-antigen ligase family protein [Terracidiphilus sp.]|jgi:O-antigen ligase
MGLFLSVLYLVTHYLTPQSIFGPLAEARVELIVAVLVLLISLLPLTKSFTLKTPQSLALIGLAFAVFVSVFIETHWPGGAVQSFLLFIPNAFAYFVICLHCNSRKKLQVVVLMLLFVCLFVIVQGSIALHHGVPVAPRHNPAMELDALPTEATTIPYLLAMRDDSGEMIFRLKGLGEINDPNDFGQLIVCVVPLVFIFWRSKKAFWNLLFVVAPVCLLLYGMFLTHSRGALLALIAVAVVAARRRVGTLPALFVAGAVFAAAMALHFTGGRGISAESGLDRTALWGEGLQILKSHPFFGVGISAMPNYTDSHLTAHNSVVVCAAELGLFGLYFWSLFLLPTLRDALAAASPEKLSEAEQRAPEANPFSPMTSEIAVVDKAEINRLGQLMVLSLTGFLVAGWFLSRAFIMTLFLLGGMVEVVYQMALERGMIAPRMRLGRVIPYAGGLAAALVLMMYLMLRVLNLAR